MTIARTALRLLTTQALKGNSSSRPTIAAGHIYDSRLTPEQPEYFNEDAKPLVIIFTDGDEGDALSDQNGGPPFHRLIDLVFDIGMVAGEKADNDADGYNVFWPDTDARLEASLDTLEAQIWRYLSTSLDPLPLLFRRLVRVWKHESHRQGDDDAALKTARRLVTFTCEISDDQFEVLNSASALPTGLNVLPDPLRTVALAMPAGSEALTICNAVAAALAPLVAPPFTGVDTTVDAKGDQVASSEVILAVDPSQP